MARSLFGSIHALEFLYVAHASGWRYAVLRGGTRSGKTFSALHFIVQAGLLGKYKLCSIVSRSVPHLRRGALRDFRQVLAQYNLPHREYVNEKRFVFAGFEIEFFSADQPEKLRGAQRDWLFVNEANLIGAEEFSELDVRTRSFVIVDFNPVGRFWLNDMFAQMGLDLEKHTHVSTYRDNPFLSPEQVATIENRRGIAEWWRVYGEGEWGAAAGQAWYSWELGEVQDGEWDAVGVDFGEGRSPHAVVGLRAAGDALEARELYYGAGGLGELVELLRAVRAKVIVADPAQLDYINLLRRAGVDVYPARKMQLSASYALLNKYRIRIDGANLHREAAALEWADRGRGLLRVGQADHAVDAMRYALHAIV